MNMNAPDLLRVVADQHGSDLRSVAKRRRHQRHVSALWHRRTVAP